MNNKYPYFKMRIWDKVTKRMFTPLGENEDYENLPKKRKHEIDLQAHFHIYPNSSISYYGTWCSADVIPMLWVGLCDIDGVDIYDKDILQHADGTIFYVRYSLSFCAFRAFYSQNDDSNLSLQIGENGMAKVIGNLYQNPELLEGKDV